MGNVTEEDEAKANGTHLYTDYTYDAANQLTLADAPTDTYYYTYDAQGNEVTDGSKSLTYGYDNELKSYASGSTTTNYVYDATGQRLEKNTGATPTYQYVNIGNEQVLVTKNVPSSSYNYNVYGNDMISQGDTAASTRQYFLDDGMGNVKYLTSNTGATVATYAYDPYGLQISGSTTASNFTYQNEQKDPESGLTYLRARSYDPTIARFTAQDPLSGTLGDPSTQNGYNYANNDPINMSDPTGMKSIWDNAKDITGLTTFENNIAKGCDVGSIITSGLEAAANLSILIPGVGEGDLAAQGALRGGLAFEKTIEVDRLAAPTIKQGVRGGEGVGKAFSQSTRAQAFENDKTLTCVFCGRAGTGTQVDHAASRATGGNNSIENAQLACPHCNASKGAGLYPKTPPADYKGSWPPPWWP